MGLLRTLLALIVVFAHAYGPVLIGSENAVKMFYMISGFLISYIVVEKKSYSKLQHFYINRYLRIYPIYAAVALLTLTLMVVQAVLLHQPAQVFTVLQSVPSAAQSLLVFSNLFIFLQDVVMFTGIHAQNLIFVSDYSHSEVLLYQGLLIPQAWTLSLELMFYLIAPLVLPRRKVLLVLLGASVAVRIYLVNQGLTHDPWSYRFFPAELMFFLLGALSHQLLLPRYREHFTPHHLNALTHSATALLLGFIVVYAAIPDLGTDLGMVKDAFLFGLCFVCLPLLFLYQTQHRWDAWIADLSYPIYIGHILVIAVVHAVFKVLGVEQPLLMLVFVMMGSVMFAMVLNRYVATPVETLRQKIKYKQYNR